MKSVVISQPRYLPAGNYIHRMMLTDVFVYLDNVQFSPRDFENRNKIKTANGALLLTVPVVQNSRSQLIRDIRIDNSQAWKKKHFRSLEQSYAKSAHWADYSEMFREIYGGEWDFLIDLDHALIEKFAAIFGLNCRYLRASELNIPAAAGEALLIEICKSLGANQYISGSNGREYITAGRWQEAGINVRYHDYGIHPYPQLHGDFTPWMSVCDLLFNCGPRSKEILCRQQPMTFDELSKA